MTQSRTWSTALALIAAAVIQAAIAPHMRVAGVVPSFPLLVVITLALVNGASSGAVAGFVAGLLLDLLGSGPIGAWAFVLTLVGYTAGMLQANVFAEGWLLPFTVALLAGLAAELVYLIVLIVLGSELPFWRSLFSVVLPRGMYNAVLALAVYPWLSRALRPDRRIRSFRRVA
ncbi:MAG: rod shape-determining protein MreD [Coriobacteriia bacterium]|nr:rod shape-determining protein MreD [Coriobacteriia bacterium]